MKSSISEAVFRDAAVLAEVGPMLRQVADGVLIHQRELLQNNGLPRERPSRVGPAHRDRLLDAS